MPIKIGPHDFEEAICDLGASVNIMPKEQPWKKAKGKKEKNQLEGTQKLKFEKGKLEFVNMINTRFGKFPLWYDCSCYVDSPFITKRGDSGLPMIECSIGPKVFHNVFCDLGSGVNIMSKVTHDNLLGGPLSPTSIQL
jgi:hypothetical protein